MVNFFTLNYITMYLYTKIGRSTIRNPWAHCNFDEWDVIQYQTSFQVMYQFIRNIKHSPKIEAQLLADLTKWETIGKAINISF